ncbi:MAG: hypothetical protein WA373_08655 [Burkholderiales bacterium]
MGVEPPGNTPEQSAAMIKNEIARFRPVVKAANIKADQEIRHNAGIHPPRRQEEDAQMNDRPLVINDPQARSFEVNRSTLVSYNN